MIYPTVISRKKNSRIFPQKRYIHNRLQLASLNDKILLLIVSPDQNSTFYLDNEITNMMKVFLANNNTNKTHALMKNVSL